MEVGAVANSLIKGLFYVFSGVLIIVFLGVITYYVRLQAKFKDFVIIRSRDKHGTSQIRFDYGAVIKSRKTGTELYMLRRDKKAKIGTDSITYTFTNKGKRIVELFHNDNGNYAGLRPSIKTDGIDYQVTQSDVDWAIDQFTAFQKAFTEQSKFWQLLPYIGITLMFLALVIIGIYLIKAYPQLIGGINSAAASMAEVAKAQAGVIT